MAIPRLYRRGHGVELPSGAVTAQRRTPGLAMQRSQGQAHQPLSPEGAPQAADVRLGHDRAGHRLESGPVRVWSGPGIPQRENVDHQVHPGGTGGKFLEDEGVI